jgi:5-methylcytosine-specific restriction endonuclease McrA
MNAATRRLVRKRSGRRCEYCRIHEDDEPFAFHLEHIIPKKHGGKDHHSNLAWSCQHCNLGKGVGLVVRLRGKIVPLYNPRRQDWIDHFRWNGAARGSFPPR